MSSTKCEMHSSFKSSGGSDVVYNCPHDAKFRLKYTNGHKEKRVLVCGVHKRSMEQMHLRLKKRGFDNQLIVEDFPAVSAANNPVSLTK